ncbi:MAG: hypothetical protein ACT4OV_09675 [Microthrixaceae bacterium]
MLAGHRSTPRGDIVAVAVDREFHPAQPIAAVGALGWRAVVGGASLAAGAVHAAAIGTHSEHRQAMVAFTIVAAIQLGFGALVLARSSRVLLALGGLVNLLLLGGFVLAKVDGIWFIDGLDTKERLQTADGVAAALAVVIVLAATAALLRLGEGRIAGHPLLTGGTAVVVAALAIPGMLTAGTHAHGASAHDTHAASDASPAARTEPASAVPPKAYDPTLPIDLSGVPGVTPQQQARAENLLAITILRLPKFADPVTAEAMGFVSIGDGFLGHEHYLNLANMNDDKILDPDYPESLVYDTSGPTKRLAAAMFMMNPGDTLADVPDVGGKLTQWHVHDNLCFNGAQVAGLTDAEGKCAPGLTKGAETPMIHVWIEPHPCGPFAALEGVAGGTIAKGETRLCDQAHGSH